ncbi:MAG: enoyl-CoA hydratase/isomerase family protein [Betaproteobacteria bacterium]|nr:enoyl-CoA hydratase/isomerase family protein [Betaproteobacteria bacterium]
MPESPTSQIKIHIDGAVATVILDRAEKLHALTPEMMGTLADIAARIDADAGIRCVILTAAGDKAFCVGADINAWAALEPLDMWRRWVRRGHQVFDQWARLRVPVIAAINGHAFGGGLELAAVADIRIAVASARFGLPEAAIATCPGWSGTQRLAALIGASQVKYLALTGTRIDAMEAWRIGILHEQVKDNDVLARARELAAGISKLAPVSVQLTKQIIDAGRGDGLAAALETMAGALAATTADAREGVASFREKRQPEYRGN